MDWLTIIGFLLWTGMVAVLTAMVVRKMPSSGNASDDYFAGGRSFKWYVVAGSLMLTNLSSEQLVGLNGTVFTDGCLTGIWWEAGAAVTIMITAGVFLPRYLSSGVITTSSFLGERYDRTLRSWVSLMFVFYYSLVLCPTVLYAGALTIQTIFDWTDDDVPLPWISTGIGIVGAIYAISGGLKAVAVSDCFNGIGLLIIGLAVPLMAISKLPNGMSDVFSVPERLLVWTETCQVWNEGSRLRSETRASVPWSVVPFGMTLNNMYYWATNQLIVQRALGAESLAQGQKGVVFAACMKVMGFAFLCIPGIVGVMFEELQIPDQNGNPFTVGGKADTIYPRMVNAVMPGWSRGLFLGVLLGSVLSTFNSALNSAATMFALETYKIYINPEASPDRTVFVANVFGVFLTIAAMGVAPLFRGSESIFQTLQLFNTMMSLPILSVFFVGIFTSLPDATAGKTGFVAGIFCIMGMQVFNPGNPFYGDDVPDYAIFHFLRVFELSFLFAMEVICIMTFWPAGRRFVGGSDRPTPYQEPKNKSVVDMTPWKPLPMVIVALLFVLTLLLGSLQYASQTAFYLFWAMWFVVCAALIFAPVPEATPSAGLGKAASDMALAFRTNSITLTGTH